MSLWMSSRDVSDLRYVHVCMVPQTVSLFRPLGSHPKNPHPDIIRSSIPSRVWCDHQCDQISNAAAAVHKSLCTWSLLARWYLVPACRYLPAVLALNLSL